MSHILNFYSLPVDQAQSPDTHMYYAGVITYSQMHRIAANEIHVTSFEQRGELICVSTADLVFKLHQHFSSFHINDVFHAELC